MVSCAVYGCNNNSQKKSCAKVSFYTFPKNNVEQCAAWVNFCKRSDNISIKFARICGDHFEDCLKHWNLKHRLLGYSPTHQRKIKPGAVPTLKAPKDSPTPGPSSIARAARANIRVKKRLIEDLDMDEDITTVSGSVDAVQEELQLLKKRVAQLEAENALLKMQSKEVTKITDSTKSSFSPRVQSPDVIESTDGLQEWRNMVIKDELIIEDSAKSSFCPRVKSTDVMESSHGLQDWNNVVIKDELIIEGEMKQEVIDSNNENEETSELLAVKEETSSNTDVNRTLQTTGEKSYQCKQCLKIFSRRSYLIKIHERVHSGEKPYQCKQCKKKFLRRYYLKQHESVHTGEKPYKCTECLKCFTSSGYLKMHQRLHTGDKRYQCKQCCKLFCTNSQLKRHERIHTGEKPYQCKQCSKLFRTSSNLQAHERLHTREKPYQCKQCMKFYTTRMALRRHEQLHTGEKPH